MKISMQQEAIEWFEEEVGIPEGCGIRFKARLYGTSPVLQGYALSFEPNHPSQHLGAEFTSDNGLKFYVEEDDLWFFDGHDLVIEYNHDLDEPVYIYEKNGQRIQ